MTVKAAIVLPLAVIVPVPRMAAVKLIYDPPLDKVKLLRFNDVAGRAKTVLPKLSVLNQLPVVIVCIAVPDPVKVKLGLLVIEPPVVPNVNVLTTLASLVNPPVPV